MTTINRRRFLYGLGGITVGLPFLTKLSLTEAMAAAPTHPKRLLMLSYPMGMATEMFKPSAAGSSFNLPYISAPLEPFKSSCLFVTGCDMAVTFLNKQHHYGHPGKKEAALTGTLLQEAFGGDRSNQRSNVLDNREGADRGGPNGASVCHYIGSQLRQAHHSRSSIDLGINGNPARNRDDMPSDFYFEGAANPVTMQCNPSRALHALFGPADQGQQAQEAMRALRRKNKSVLDAVRASFTDLRQGLDAPDRATLDDHADRLRQIELDIDTMRQCVAPPNIPGAREPDASWDPFRGESMRTLGEMQQRILGHAIACDMAPVGRLEYFEQQNPRFGVNSIDQAIQSWNAIDSSQGWHAMVHGDPSPIDGISTRPKGGGATYAPYLLDGYRFFVQQLASLLQTLKDTPEGPDGQSALDHTLVVMASDYGNGDGHRSAKTNWVLAGNTGGAKNGFHMDCAPGKGFWDASDYHTNHMLTSIIQMFDIKDASGAPINEFGLRGFSQGPINPLFG